MTCTASGVAAAGQYANIGSVTAVDPFGTPVNDTDPSHYFGAAPGIDIEKATNGVDADNPPGPFIPVGNAVDVDLRRAQHGQRRPHRRHRDRRPGRRGLLPGEHARDRRVDDVHGRRDRRRRAVREHGDRDRRSPTASPSQDSDASHYFGEDASVDIEKLVNGVDADVPTGPLVGVGDPGRLDV